MPGLFDAQEPKVTWVDRAKAIVPPALVGVLFVFIGYTKFDGNPRGGWFETFERIGIGQWFRIFTGVAGGGRLADVRAEDDGLRRGDAHVHDDRRRVRGPLRHPHAVLHRSVLPRHRDRHRRHDLPRIEFVTTYTAGHIITSEIHHSGRRSSSVPKMPSGPG